MQTIDDVIDFQRPTTQNDGMNDFRRPSIHSDDMPDFRRQPPLEAPVADPADGMGETGERDRLNGGSFGHPDFCSRACLYFINGSCSNGSNCTFCHLRHPQRPVHLDKRHRDVLKGMPLADCTDIMFPILREKVQRLDLGDEAMLLLDRLWEYFAQAAVTRATEDLAEVEAFRKSGRIHRTNKRSLSSVLGAMNVRSLLLMLNGRTGQDAQVSQLQEFIRSFLQHCKTQSYLRHQKVAMPL